MTRSVVAGGVAVLVAGAAEPLRSADGPLSLQERVDRQAAAGGGTVTVAAGDYEDVRPFRLRSNVTLRLEKGAVLHASTNRADYAAMPGEDRGAFVSAVGATNVAFVGEGRIECSGDRVPKVRGVPGRWRGVHFQRCRGVRIEGVTLANAHSWCCYLQACEDVVVRKVTIVNHANFNNDGLDLEVRNALVEDCDIDSDDDSIVLKNRDPGFVVENVEVRRCRVGGNTNSIKIGTESAGDFRNILIQDCVVAPRRNSVAWPLSDDVPGLDKTVPSGKGGIVLATVDGGTIEDVTVRNVRMEGVETPIYVRLGRRKGGERESALRNVLIENVQAKAVSRIACSVTGVPGEPKRRPENVVLRNVILDVPGGTAGDARLSEPVPECEKGYPSPRNFKFHPLPACGVYIRHADGVKLENVTVVRRAPDCRPDFVREDCSSSNPTEAVARDAMNFRFTVCGIPHQFKDGKIDWAFNPTYNGYREWPWQFARMDFLPDLAAYFRRTGDEKAAEAIVGILSSFIDTAPPPPPGTGAGATISWRTLDAGLRASNWIEAWPAFTNSPALTADFKAKVFRSLEDHLRRLETPITSNNWRIMELKGLVDITLAFPSVARAAERRAAAERELADILAKQLYPDGFHFELSTGYHGILDADYSHLANRYRQYGVTPPAFLEKGIELAFELYPHLTCPDRQLPSLNDAGRCPIVEKMKVASKLYPQRQDFLWFATDGKKGRAPDYLSYAFPYSGAVVFRDSWSEDAVWGYVDMSPFGRGHQHEDKLNFLLFAYGKEMLCEGGIYDYDTSEMRKYVLSTRAHNTIRIDGKDQNARFSWRWTDDKLHRKADLTFASTPERDVAVSTFALGYGKDKDCDDTVSHTRTVEFVKDGGAPFFRITDELVSKDDRGHAYEQMWHLETCELKMKDDAFTANFGGGVTLEAAFVSANGKLTDMIGQKEPQYQGWMPIRPSGPHEHRPIHTPILKGTFVGSAKITVTFRPKKADLN